MEKLPWIRRLLISTILISLSVADVFGQKHQEESDSGISESYEKGPFKYEGGYSQYKNSEQETTHPQGQYEEFSSSAREHGAKAERIMKPTVGDFKPSPPVKFPETLTPPTSITAYGEIDTTAADYGDALPRKVHPSPYGYYGKYQGSSSQQVHYSHPHAHPPSYPQNHEVNPEQYREYDSAIPEERPYQHYLPPPSTYYHPAPPPAAQETSIFLKDQFKGPWKTLVKALTALVPIGLFLAALPPNFISINSTAARTGKEGRTAEDGLLDEEDLLKEEYPVLDLMGRFGLSALDDPECDSRIFCEMSRLGEREEGNMVQRFFWTIVNEAPDMLTEIIGVKKLFKAVRTGSCDTYKCKESQGNSR